MYGITDESQLIDIETIKKECEAYINVMDSFSTCSNEVSLAADMCNKDALSVDDITLEYSIRELSKKIADIKKEYVENANTLYTQALRVYNVQKIELAEYLAKKQNVGWLEMIIYDSLNI